MLVLVIMRKSQGNEHEDVTNPRSALNGALKTKRDAEEVMMAGVVNSKSLVGKEESKQIEALISSQAVLSAFREKGSVQLLKEKQRREGPAYGMFSLNAGGLLGLMAGVRAGFKSLNVTEVNKTFNAMAMDFTGIKSLGDTFDQDYTQMHSPPYVTVTTECPNYSRGSPEVLKGGLGGVDGQSGWQFIMSLRPIMTLKPLIVEYEMVSHAVNVHNGAEVNHVIKTLTECDYVLKAAIVEMKAYGDLVSKNRLIMVGCSTALGEYAKSYQIPIGDYSDAVSFCAADVVESPHRPELFKTMPDKPERPRSKLPGTLQIVARTRQGHGYSTRPNASVSLNGLMPSITTHGAGRHQPEGWQEGDRVGESYMFSEETAARAQNLSESYAPYLRSFCTDEKERESIVMKAVGMGIGQRFGYAMASAAHETLLLAGVPFDILSTKTKVTPNGVSKVTHKLMNENEWLESRQIKGAKKQKQESRASECNVPTMTAEMHHKQPRVLTSGGPAGIESKENAVHVTINEVAMRVAQLDSWKFNVGVQKAVFDTGAQRIVLHEEDVGRFVTGSENSDVVIVPAAKGSEFRPSQVGELNMLFPTDKAGRTTKMLPVITAPQEILQKALLAYEPFYESEMQLDIRTPEATRQGFGYSRMWSMKPDEPSIPLHRDDEGKRWWVYYLPVEMNTDEHKSILHAMNLDAMVASCGVHEEAHGQMDEDEAMLVTVAIAAEAMVNEVVTSRTQTEAKTSTAKLPDGKRMEILRARSLEDYDTRGVKCNMPKSKFKRMPHAVFARHMNHTGCGPRCPICLQASGAMRTIFKIVDKYMDLRSGYMWSMDMQIMSHRSKRGMKYYVTMRCMASKYIMGFKLARKNDITSQFQKYVTELRADPIYKNYDWQMVSVVKLDNDGAWLRKNKAWVPMIEDLGVRMFYVSHDRNEDSAEAESTVKVVSIAGMKGMLARNAEVGEWDVFWDHGRWVLNRVIALSSSAERSPDGDQARPIETFTHGWYSRQRCNSELAYSEMPHTPLLVHDVGVKNQQGKSKVVWKVAYSMYMDQIVCFDPWTGYERKTKSFDAFRLRDGIGYRQFFNLGPSKLTRAERPLAEDFTEEATVFLPPPNAETKDMKQWKLPAAIDMVKHVMSGKRVPGLVLQRGSEAGVEPEISVVDLWADAEAPNSAASQVLTGVQSYVEPELMSDNEEDDENEESGVHKDKRRIDDDVQGASMVNEQEPKKLSLRKKAKVIPESEIEFDQETESTKKSDKPEVVIADDDDEMWHRAEMGKARFEAYVVPDQKTCLPKVLRKLDVKPLQSELYKQWCIKYADAGFGEENWPGDTRKPLPEGMKFPKPQGGKWKAMQEHFWKSKGLETNVVVFKTANPKELESAVVKAEAAAIESVSLFGMQMARLLNAVGRMSSGVSKQDDQVSILATKVKAKNNLAVLPPPKNLAQVWEHEKAEKWLSALGNEFRALTDMGVVTHGHTAADLHDLNITVRPIPTQVIFENKFCPADYAGKSRSEITAELKARLVNEPEAVVNQKIEDALSMVKFLKDGRVTTDVNFDKEKARVVVVGNKKNMTKGVHFEETFASTPRTESANVLSAIIVNLRLKTKAFDIKNAFCWADQKIKLPLQYPFGMPQFNGFGEQTYMLMHKNSYGKPDGSKLFEDERNSVWMEKFNCAGMKCVIPYNDRSFFFILVTVSELENELLKSEIEEEQVIDERLESMNVIPLWMLVHTDDANMASFSKALMNYVIKISNEAWKVKEVDPLYMLGVQHVLTIERGVWRMEHSMPLYISGLVESWKEWLALDGWEKSKPSTPAPQRTMLTLHDPLAKVSDEEVKTVLRRGYMNLAGGLVWPIKNCFPEMMYFVSNVTTVMSRPTEAAWSYAMHGLAWLRDHKHEGIVFRSDKDVTPVAFVDAALEIDLADGRCRAGHDIQMAGGPVLFKSQKIQKVAFGIPGAEYMQLRNCAVEVMWLRNLLDEIGLKQMVQEPTEIHCDSSGAMDWAKFGKITVGNKHMALAYHEVQQWLREKEVKLVKVLTALNRADFYTKSPTIATTERFVKWIKGRADPPSEFLKNRERELAKSNQNELVKQ